MIMKEVKEVFRFVFSSDLWKMGLLWSFALVSSYLQLLKANIFGSKSIPSSVSVNPKIGSSRPICVITGVSEVKVVLFTCNLLISIFGPKITHFCVITGVSVVKINLV